MSCVEIDFDQDAKIFFLKSPIFQLKELSSSVRHYVLAQANHYFKPHRTSFSIEGSQVFLEQQIPFDWGFQPSLKEQVYAFQKLSILLKKRLQEIETEALLELSKSL